ncbi:ATP phosphoribosyltransferase regulatory subunit [Romboutsia sp.]|uniref:ATP phosphoribosyltransferase regulatory subunit n=1 Tax=Romboutsia sp. TaxID=1965302 RepID=UPI003F2D9338
MDFLKIQDEINYSKKRYKIKREIEDMFIEEDFAQIEPSIFEEYDDFTSINKNIAKESMVKVLNGRVLILRADITTNIIKSLIPRWEEDLKLKLFYNSTIYRNKQTTIKEFREIGCEYLGEASIDAEIEIVEMALKILNKYSNIYILEIGMSSFINSFLEEINLTKEEERTVKNLIYKKNKSDLNSYVEELNIKEEEKALLTNILYLQGNLDQIIEKAYKFNLSNKMKIAINQLIEIKDKIEKLGYLEYINFDLSMTTLLDYYEGVIIRGYYPSSYKEIIRGGRYDSLTEEYGKKVPAVGFSINLDELVKVI